MGSIDIEFLTKFEISYTEFPTFIETGTCNGGTILAVEPYFNKLYTIEIKKELYEYTRSRYNGNKISFFLGDSVDVFKSFLPTINENAIFFLDGHWSAGETGKGSKDCPLIEELQEIMSSFKHRAILIIDDRRLFGKGPKYGNEVCNWEDISDAAIISTVAPRLSKIYSLPSNLDPNDRMIIHLNSI